MKTQTTESVSITLTPELTRRLQAVANRDQVPLRQAVNAILTEQVSSFESGEASFTIPGECREPLKRAADLSGLSIEEEAKEAFAEHFNGFLIGAPVGALKPFLEAIAEAVGHEGSLPEMVRATSIDPKAFVQGLAESVVNDVTVSDEQKDRVGAIMLRTLRQLDHREWIRRDRKEAEDCLGPLMIG